MSQTVSSRIDYAGLLRTRKKPIVDQEQLSIWFTKFTAVRTKKLKLLTEKQNGCCHYCKRKVVQRVKRTHGKMCASLEHLKTLSEGGTEHLTNLVMACGLCNSSRQDIPHDQYLLLVQSGWREYVFEYLHVDRSEDDNKRRQRFALWMAYYMLVFEKYN